MSKPTCLRCHAELTDENDTFCDICGQPLRCPDCNTLLRPEARFCKKCGKPISGATSSAQVMPAISIAPGYNHLKIDETLTEFHAEMLVTNEAIRDIRDWIPQRTGIRVPMSRTDAGDNHQDRGGTVVEVASAIADPDVPQLLPASAQPAMTLTTDLPPEEAIWKIFHKLGSGKIRQVNMRLKAASKKNYTIRLIYLYLFAKEVMDEEKVHRDEVYGVLQHATVKDGNQAAYISQDDGILTVDKEYLQLTDAARIQTYQFIADVSNPELKEGWYPGMETSAKHPKGSSKRKKSGDKDTNLDRWVEHEETKALAEIVAVQHTDVAKWQVLDKTLLGLYGINKIDKEQEVIASLIAAYLNKAFSIYAKEDSIRPALLKAVQNGDSNVIPSRDGQGYRITQSGCDHIQAKLGGSAKP